MIKKLIVGVVALALIAGVLLFFLGSSALNKGVKSGIETFGPKVTQTPVTLRSANLSVLSGSGNLSGLIVGNPEGFKAENVFELGSIDVEVDKGSILTDTVIINKIHIQEPAISYERTLTSSNIKRLQQNIEAFTGPRSDAAADEKASGSTKKLVIKELIIEGGTIHIGALGVGQTVPLPRIEMSNLGQGGTSTNAAEVVNQILTRVLTSIGPAIANAGELSKEAAEALKTQGLEKAGQAADKAGEAAGKAAESIKNVFGY